MTALVDDALLPAAPYLTSAAAADVLAPAIAASGATLVSCAPVQVQYRPGSDLVVRYRVETSDRDGRRTDTTVLAGTTVNGPPPGTLTVEGEGLTVGVWQWPFDPTLPGLGPAVTPAPAAAMLAGHLAGPLTLEVVVFRPTERAVVRATDTHGRRAYVKVVPPASVDGLVRRHRRLGEASLPVPEVLTADRDLGVVVLAELAGPTLRDLVKAGAGSRAWPAPAEFVELRRRMASVDPDDLPGRSPRTADAAAHARMLAEVVPDERARLDRIAACAAGVAEQAELGTAVIHGDLHEAQVIVTDGRITGLLDVDDVGPGAPLDDLATVLGHLRYRAATDRDRLRGRAITTYADRLRTAFGAEVGTDAAVLDAATAAVLVGLATGPFRVQMDGWRAATRAVLDVAEGLLGDPMREVSDRPHRGATTAPDDGGVGRYDTSDRT